MKYFTCFLLKKFNTWITGMEIFCLSPCKLSEKSYLSVNSLTCPFFLNIHLKTDFTMEWLFEFSYTCSVHAFPTDFLLIDWLVFNDFLLKTWKWKHLIQQMIAVHCTINLKKLKHCTINLKKLKHSHSVFKWMFKKNGQVRLFTDK
jgi:hypothetical protein